MFVGAAGADGTAMALSYRSDDLEAWEYEGVALSRSTSETADVWMGALWECPQIFEIDGRAVMVSSVWDDDVLHYAGYAVGTYASRHVHRDPLGAPHLWRQLLRAIPLPRRRRATVPELLDARHRRRNGGLGRRAQRAIRAHTRRRHPGRDPAPRPRALPDRGLHRRRRRARRRHDMDPGRCRAVDRVRRSGRGLAHARERRRHDGRRRRRASGSCPTPGRFG